MTAVAHTSAFATVLRWTRRRRGWRVDTEAGFKLAIDTTVLFLEADAQLPSMLALERKARLAAVHAKLIDVLSAKCGRPVEIWQLVVDDKGALAEATLGFWTQTIRIEPKRRAK